MGGAGILKLGAITWGKGTGVGEREITEWIKYLPEGTLPKPTFRLDGGGAQGAVAPGPSPL